MKKNLVLISFMIIGLALPLAMTGCEIDALIEATEKAKQATAKTEKATAKAEKAAEKVEKAAEEAVEEVKQAAEEAAAEEAAAKLGKEKDKLEARETGQTTKVTTLMALKTTLEKTLDLDCADKDKGKAECSITLDNDIDLTGSKWVPIGTLDEPFRARLNGNNKKISGLATDKNTQYAGLFAYIGKGGVVKDLTIDAPTIEGKYSVGALAGQNKGRITDVKITGEGTVTGTDNVGGLVGKNDGTIENSYVTGTVEGAGNVGGLVGENWDGSIKNSYATGAVTGGQANNAIVMIGGLVGKNAGTIENSYATGTVTGNGNNAVVSGLVGENLYEGTIKNSYATGAVTGNGSNAVVGGLVGKNSGTIKNSYATGAVEGTGSYANVGGLVGYHSDGTIENSYVTGAVTGTADNTNVGGLVGKRAFDRETIKNSYFDKASTGRDRGIGDDENNQGRSVIGVSKAANIVERNSKYYNNNETPDEGDDTQIFINWEFPGTWIFTAGQWPKLRQ